jgi:hypothetical protein
MTIATIRPTSVRSMLIAAVCLMAALPTLTLAMDEEPSGPDKTFESLRESGGVTRDNRLALCKEGSLRACLHGIVALAEFDPGTDGTNGHVPESYLGLLSLSNPRFPDLVSFVSQACKIAPDRCMPAQLSENLETEATAYAQAHERLQAAVSELNAKGKYANQDAKSEFDETKQKSEKTIADIRNIVFAYAKIYSLACEAGSREACKTLFTAALFKELSRDLAASAARKTCMATKEVASCEALASLSGGASGTQSLLAAAKTQELDDRLKNCQTARTEDACLAVADDLEHAGRIIDSANAAATVCLNGSPQFCKSALARASKAKLPSDFQIKMMNVGCDFGDSEACDKATPRFYHNGVAPLLLIVAFLLCAHNLLVPHRLTREILEAEKATSTAIAVRD